MNNIFTNNINDLAEIQRGSFYNFLTFGISEELVKITNPFITYFQIAKRKKKPCLVFLYPSEIKLKGPNSNLNNCLKNYLSYSIQVYVKGQYVFFEENKDLSTFSKKEKIQIKQDILLCDLPLMTEDGTFIINGYERVIINQIIRKPGVYFKKEFTQANKILYTATIISDKGSWTKFILENFELKNTKKVKDIIYYKIPESKSKLGSDQFVFSIYELIKFFGITFEEFLDSVKYPLHIVNHQVENLQKNLENVLQIRKNLFNYYSNCFSIGKIGRDQLNSKFNLNLPQEIKYLTTYDFIHIINELISLKYHNRENDDIDDLENKQIRSVGDLLQNQFRLGLYRLQKQLINESILINSFPINKNRKILSLANNCFLDPRPITTLIKEFFKTSQLSQFLDQVNPLAELTHKRRISLFGPNGLKRDHISTTIRDIHPTQYGRLCPIETPEGQNAGLISSLSILGRVNFLGNLETPYFLLKNQSIFSNLNCLFLNSFQEKNLIVGFSEFFVNKFNKINKKIIPAKIKSAFLNKDLKMIDLVTVSPLQIISIATSLIPFLEHDDANRALMGSNMQRQAVPLLYPQKSIVGTGLEISAILDSSLIIKSYSAGNVTFVSNNLIQINDFKNQIINYKLKKYYRSNQETAINQRPIVWTGEEIFSGQIIADGPGTIDGELALGRNLTIAYMPWEGYNYEDAIVINERLIFEDTLTSIHIEEYECPINYSIYGNDRLSYNLSHFTKYIQRNLSKYGIINLGAYVKENDILVSKLTPCDEDPSPEAKLLRALYGKKNLTYKDTSLRVPQGVSGRVIDIRIESNTNFIKEDTSTLNEMDVIRIYIAQIRKIRIGDKLSGRHGNKGIISKILSQQDMPYLEDGTPIDILLNPLGVPSRMNVGQVFESLLGLAGEKLGKRFKIFPFDEIYGSEASRILVNQKLKEASLKTNWIFNSFYPGKLFLKDGRSGEFFDNPVLVGKSYILKLIHLVEEKIHARATGAYSMITEQPLAGKSQKGGQRFGEMEVWALEAYGCSNTLQELLTIKADDIDGRNDIYQAIIHNYKKPVPSVPESFLALIRELNSLGLDFSLRKFVNLFKNSTQFEQQEEDIFKKLEIRLQLRAILNRKKNQLSKMFLSSMNSLMIRKKAEEKRIILHNLKNKKFY